MMYCCFLLKMRILVLFAVPAILVLSVVCVSRADPGSAGTASAERWNIAKTNEQTVHSIIPLQKEFNTLSDWYAVAYEGDSMFDRGAEEIPSRLCFRKGRNRKDEKCFLAQICCLSTGKPYQCWAVQDLKVIPFFEKSHPKKVLEFRAQFYGFGIDHLDLITLWSYDRKTDSFTQITPKDKSKAIALNSQDTYRPIDFNRHGSKKILAVSHFIWGKDEGYFDDHFYRVAIYAYRPGEGFVSLGKYKTKKKYLGDDVAERPELFFDSEIGNIRSFVYGKLK